jgi:hypothetical protein
MSIANTHSKWELGAQVWYPEGNEQRWLDAHGDNVVKYIEDFAVCPRSTNAAMAANNPEWIITHTSAGAGCSLVQPADLKGGWLNISPAASDNDGINMQHANESFRVEANSWLYFGVRYKVSEATQDDFLLGLCEQDVSVLTNTSHGIYFKKIDGETKLYCCTVKDQTTAKTLIATTGVAADTVYIDEFIVKSTGDVEFWHNGSTVGKYTTPIPSTDLAVTFHFLTGANTSTEDLYIDWVRCIQILNARAT